MSVEPFNAIFMLISGITLESWEIFVEAAPYLIFGFGVAGILNIFIPDQKIMKNLGEQAGKISSVIKAALAGLPLPLCSCGVIPAAMSLRKRGANKGATLSFLISTPETGIDSIAITYALLDPIMAIFRPLATLITAILAGFAENILIGEGKEKIEKKGSGERLNSEKKAGILTVSTLIGVSGQRNPCSPSSCSCSHPVDPKLEKSETLKISSGVEVKTDSIKNALTDRSNLNSLENSNKSHESLLILPQKNPANPIHSILKETTSNCSCETCGCKEKEIKKEIDYKKENKHSLKVRLLQGIKYAYIDLPGDISKWMLIGILLAGIISYVVPENLIQNYLGGGLSSMFVMLIIGIPLYICATASTPLAASLIAKGMSPGTAFVFLLAGPATNVATITMVARFLGKRSAVLYVGVISLCALGAGFLLDWIYLSLGISAVASLGTAKELLPEDLKIGFAILLLPLMLYGIFLNKKDCTC